MLGDRHAFEGWMREKERLGQGFQRVATVAVRENASCSASTIPAHTIGMTQGPFRPRQRRAMATLSDDTLRKVSETLLTSVPGY